MLQVLTGHTNAVPSLLALPDNQLISVSYDQRVRIFDLSNGQSKTLEGYNYGFILKVSLLCDNIIVTICSDKTAKLWSVKEGKMIRTLKLCNYGYALQVLKDGTFVTGGLDEKVTFWK